jgi:hypothetical protein
MLRYKVLASAVVLIVATVFARGEFANRSHPCIAIGNASVQLTSVPARAQLQVSFTDDPASASIRVQISDSPEAADFVVIDDVDSPETGACGTVGRIRRVVITAETSAAAPVIYLSAEGPADYRIFVHSKRFTARDAAALVVGAGGGRSRLAAASL